jgi:hypothetical protein
MDASDNGNALTRLDRRVSNSEYLEFISQSGTKWEYRFNKPLSKGDGATLESLNIAVPHYIGTQASRTAYNHKVVDRDTACPTGSTALVVFV